MNGTIDLLNIFRIVITPCRVLDSTTGCLSPRLGHTTGLLKMKRLILRISQELLHNWDTLGCYETWSGRVIEAQYLHAKQRQPLLAQDGGPAGHVLPGPARSRCRLY